MLASTVQFSRYGRSRHHVRRLPRDARRFVRWFRSDASKRRRISRRSDPRFRRV